ncbi:MAG TPA: hypothetical protein VIW26_14985, partial [Gemmatimonadales bacterium]
QARARLEREDGALVRQLFNGTLRDSLTLAWDGLDGGTSAVPPGRYRLVVSLIGSATTTDQDVRVPLAIEQWVTPPAAPMSAAPSAAPQVAPQANPGRGWPTLIAGVAAAVAAATLPHAVSPGVDNSSRRLVVPIAIGTAGVLGFVLQRRAPAPPRALAGTPRPPPSSGPGNITLVVHAGPVPARQGGGAQR